MTAETQTLKSRLRPACRLLTRLARSPKLPTSCASNCSTVDSPSHAGDRSRRARLQGGRRSGRRARWRARFRRRASGSSSSPSPSRHTPCAGAARSSARGATTSCSARSITSCRAPRPRASRPTKYARIADAAHPAGDHRASDRSQARHRAREVSPHLSAAARTRIDRAGPSASARRWSKSICVTRSSSCG